MGHITALILAAGEGKRMRSEKAKVIHQVNGKAMIEWVMRGARCRCCRCVAVVGHKPEKVMDYWGTESNTYAESASAQDMPIMLAHPLF